jgi:hypothetical protein
MTELAMRQDTNNLPILANDNFDRLAAWARAAEATHQMATRLVETSFVPEAFRKKPHEATAAILAGAELGFDPMASLRCFDVINGTASPRAITLRAVVQSKGHEMWEEESTPERAVVKGIRKGSTKVRESVWTIQRAKDLGVTGKDNWRKQPQNMLLARATAECARLVAADAILGIPYSSEELADMDEPIRGEITVAPKVTTAEILGTTESVEDSLPPVETINKAQSAKLHALLNEAGLGNRDDGLALLSQLLGRDVDTTKTLTKTEASFCIDSIDQKLARQATIQQQDSATDSGDGFELHYEDPAGA